MEKEVKLEPSNEASDWRTRFPAESRQKVISKIMESLKKHLKMNIPEGYNELHSIAKRFEEKMYNQATSQNDYVRRISTRIVAMETKTQKPELPNPQTPNSTCGDQNSPDSTSATLQPKANNQDNTVVNQSSPQQLYASTPAAVENSSYLTSTAGQNLPRNITETSRNSQNYSVGHGLANMYATSQMQMQGTLPQPLDISNQPQQVANPLFHQHQLQQQISKQNGQQPLMHMSSCLQQCKSTIQHAHPSTLQSSQSSSQQNLNSAQQSVPILFQQHLQPTTISQQSALPSQQHSMGRQLNMPKGQQMQLAAQQSSLQDMQQHQQQQRLPIQQNTHLNIQQQQQMLNRQGISLNHQQLVGSLSGVLNMQPFQRSMHSLLQAKGATNLEETQRPSSTMLQSQGHQSQHQSMQQQLKSRPLSQTPQLQQQLAMHQQGSRPMEMQQRLQSQGPLTQSPDVVDKQKQLAPSTKWNQECSSTSSDSTAQNGHLLELQEKLFQQITYLKEHYYEHLMELYRKLQYRLNQPDLQKHPDQRANWQHMAKSLERAIQLLRVSKSDIQPKFEKIIKSLEAFIHSILSRTRKPHMQLQEQEQSQRASGRANLVPQQQISQTSPLQLDNQVQGLLASVSSVAGSSVFPSGTQPDIPKAQQKILNALPSVMSLDPTQGSSFTSLQQRAVCPSMQVGIGSIQCTPQHNNTIPQSSMNTFQMNISPMQPNPSLAPQQMKHDQLEQQLMQAQQMKSQPQQRHFQMQLMQQQQHMHQYQKPHQTMKFSPHQIPGLQQMSEINDLKIRQGSGSKQQFSPGQRQHYYQQQMRPGVAFLASSPQNLLAASPQISQQLSPQVEHQSPLPSLPKAGTPVQSASSIFIPPSPQLTENSPSNPGESEKQLSGISSLSNAGHAGLARTALGLSQAQAPGLVTSGISPSPFLVESAIPDGNPTNTPARDLDEPEQPIKRLIKVIQSSTPDVARSFVNDIISVVKITDGVASSLLGNDSGAAVGEDLAETTKRRLRAADFLSEDDCSRKKMSRTINASSKDESELESTATSAIEGKDAVLEEIKQINRQLIDTVVSVSHEDVDNITAAAENKEGIVVQFNFSDVSINSNLKARLASALMTPFLSMRLLIPCNYPKSSPIILDQLSDEQGKESEDLSLKANSSYIRSLRGLHQPISLGEMAKLWDSSVREIILEFAVQQGGGSFSTSYGFWRNCVSA